MPQRVPGGVGARRRPDLGLGAFPVAGLEHRAGQWGLGRPGGWPRQRGESHPPTPKGVEGRDAGKGPGHRRVGQVCGGGGDLEDFLPWEFFSFLFLFALFFLSSLPLGLPQERL